MSASSNRKTPVAYQNTPSFCPLPDRYDQGFGTLFTAEYDPKAQLLLLSMAGEQWYQRLDAFRERQHIADYSGAQRKVVYDDDAVDWATGVDWSRAAGMDWTRLAMDYAAGRGQWIGAYIPGASSRHCMVPCQQS